MRSSVSFLSPHRPSRSSRWSPHGSSGPSRPTDIKLDTYECGLEALGDIWVQFKVQYYLYALAFVIFDIEVVFLYPWAVAYNQLGLFALVEMAIFLLILVGGLVYAWKKGALEWV